MMQLISGQMELQPKVFVVSPTATTSYTVRVTKNGISSTSSIVIEVLDSEITATATTVCFGNATVTLSSSVTGASLLMVYRGNQQQYFYYSHRNYELYNSSDKK